MKLKIMLALSAAMLSSPAAILHAQMAVGDSDEALAGQADSGEIVVTARRQEESIQDVPISISAFSGEELESRGARSLEDIALLTPNMTSTGGGSGSNTFSIRGLSSTANNPGIESGIGLYVDEVYIGKSYAFMTALSDIERVEVLRGPQGTLYGRNTLGGAINVLTRRPGEQFRANADFTYGNYDQYQLRGSVSGPLSEGVSASLSGVLRQRDGYLKDFARDAAYQDEDLWGVRGKLLVDLGPRTELMLIGDYYIDRSIDGIDQVRAGALEPLDGSPLEDRRVGTNFASRSERESYGISGRLSHDFGFAELVSITAYRENKIDALLDQDFSVADISFTGRTQDQQQFTQELRLVSKGPDRFSYVLGGYFLSEQLAAVTIANLGPDAIGTSETSFTHADIDTKAFALFGSATYRFSDLVSLSGGLRYSHESKDLIFSQTLTPGAFVMPLFGISIEIPPFKDRYRQGALTGDASLSVTPTEDLLLYLSYARGFKAGGFNATITATPPQSLEFDAEFVNSYEVGLKSSFFDNKLRLNLAAFHLDYTDKQEQTRVGTFFQIQNAARASSKGFEVEILAKPHRQIQLMGGLGYTDASYKRYEDCDPFGADCSGNRLQNAPEWTVNAAARFDQPIGGKLNLFGVGQLSYTDGSFVTPDNDPQFVREPRTLVNLRAGIESVDGRWQVEAWATNLFNEVAIEYSHEFLGTVYSQLNPPRMYGVTLRTGF
ncbi:TonB-dependent receptor [Sphingosinicella rhizophila]|uniref:TonB-dependent receptor n=1 Tax=Sphingosinicella rhizophila TaxID=3050082 RepID=A0ABU3Q5X0_9SPHN|nr:TonB-dependent receptor [Sphingosinicella sp. GR2756]MDT9598807.1 TonB-dependent receptor [Sphingosinicella sp. GR2756]